MANPRIPKLDGYYFHLAGKVRSGKSALKERFLENTFSDGYTRTSPYTYTFNSKIVTIRNKPTNLWVMDKSGNIALPGTEKVYKSAQAILLVFDLTDIDSFNEIDRFHQEAKLANPDVTFALVGNKSDLVDQRKIPLEQMKQKALKLGIQESLCFEVSAKENIGIEKPFFAITDIIPPIPPVLPEMPSEKNHTHSRAAKANPFAFLKQHKREILIAFATIAILATIVTTVIIFWPAILSLPFIAFASTAIGNLGIGFTAQIAAATIAGILSIRLIGSAIVAGVSWLASKLCGRDDKSPAAETTRPGAGSTTNIRVDLKINNDHPIQQLEVDQDKHIDKKPNQQHITEEPTMAPSANQLNSEVDLLQTKNSVTV